MSFTDLIINCTDGEIQTSKFICAYSPVMKMLIQRSGDVIESSFSIESIKIFINFIDIARCVNKDTAIYTFSKFGKQSAAVPLVITCDFYGVEMPVDFIKQAARHCFIYETNQTIVQSIANLLGPQKTANICFDLVKSGSIKVGQHIYDYAWDSIMAVDPVYHAESYAADYCRQFDCPIPLHVLAKIPHKRALRTIAKYHRELTLEFVVELLGVMHRGLRGTLNAVKWYLYVYNKDFKKQSIEQQREWMDLFTAAQFPREN